MAQKLDRKPYRIFASLFLGSAAVAQSRETLDDNFITHVLIVGTDMKPRFPKEYTYTTVNIPEEDPSALQKELPKCIEFINQGRDTGSVLVHCKTGLSVSAAVCAGFIMDKLRITVDDAVSLIKEANPKVNVHPNLVRQLHVLAGDGQPEPAPATPEPAPSPAPEQAPAPATQTTTTQPETTAPTAETPTPTAEPAPEAPTQTTSENGLSADASTQNMVPSTPTDTQSIAPTDTPSPSPSPSPSANPRYTCRKCAKVLFLESDVIQHEKGEGQQSFTISKNQKKLNFGAEDDCTSIFLMEMEWMGDVSAMDGKLQCPKCASRVGTWQWHGAQCSCGAWCTPSFQVNKSRVDRKNY